MTRKLKRFILLPGREKLLFLEALVLHYTVGLLLKLIPFRFIPGLFANPKLSGSITDDKDVRSRELLLGQVRAAVQRAGKLSVWRNRCIVSSLTARRMLARRRIVSKLFFGVTKDCKGKTIAHAWLTAEGDEIVPKQEEYIELTGF